MSKLNQGDDINWAKPSFDDQTWEVYFRPKGKNLFWERMPVMIPDEQTYHSDNVIMIGTAANYDAYFDGEFIGNNTGLKEGSLSNKAGTYQTNFLIPDHLNTVGEHLLALRFHRILADDNFHSFAIIGNHASMLRTPIQISKFMFLFAGMYLIMGVYCLLMFLGNHKDRISLLFASICLLYFSLIMMEYLKLFYEYPYTFQSTRLNIIAYLNMSVAFLVPVFFTFQFSFPRPKIFAVVLLAIILGLNLEQFEIDYDDLARYHNAIMWIGSGIVVGYASITKQKKSWIVLGGLLLAIAIMLWLPQFRFPFVSSFDISLFVSFAVLILTMLFAYSLKRKEERQAYENSLLHSEKLKNELLKKNIRPHFIMNTLTSMMDWVEESPKEGVKFIGSLANEFEVLNKIADHKLVPIGQEIQLCKSHLDVMGYRKEVKYIWEEEGIDLNEIIPPAIIHTAVENGVSHSIPNKRGEVKFKLIFEKEKKYKIYRLEVHANNREKNTGTIAEGTGTKYIKSRLKESYGDAWDLTSNASPFGWETKIKIML